MYLLLLITCAIHSRYAEAAALGLQALPTTAVQSTPIGLPKNGLLALKSPGSSVSISHKKGRMAVSALKTEQFQEVMRLGNHELGPLRLKDVTVGFSQDGARYNIKSAPQIKVDGTVSNFVVLANYVWGGQTGSLCVHSEEGKKLTASAVVQMGEPAQAISKLSLGLPLVVTVKGGPVGDFIANVPDVLKMPMQALVNKALELAISQAFRIVWNKHQRELSKGKDVETNMDEVFADNSAFTMKDDTGDCPRK